jgi:exosortase/archaeosortase family protein
VVIAYEYSLSTLLSSLGQETPLAYLGLVPVISLLLAIGLIYLPGRPQRDIHDRYLDYIVGLPLLALALLMVTVGPARLSTFFWLWRLDLLSLPIFVAGAICLAFGVRMLARLLVPIAFLLLAWPPPYTLFLNGVIDSVTNLTLTALHGILGLVPLATPLAYGDGSLFQVSHGGQSFVLSVASACSGVNSVLGFVLVGLATLCLVRGPWRRRLLWLGLGVLLIWLLDVARILLIFGAGGLFGEGLAMNVLHPVAGILFFLVGVLVMLWQMPRFGLRLLGPEAGAATAPTSGEPHHAPAVRRARVSLVLIALTALAIGICDQQMASFDLLAQNLGPPRVAPFTLTDARVGGWGLTPVATFTWAKLEFGDSSTWDRYLYEPQGQAAQSGVVAPITLDVISTSDLGSFATYTVEDCYHFHGYPVADLANVGLGGGVVASAVVYDYTANERWTAVYWEWPVQTAHGQLYQRIVLNEITVGGYAQSEQRLVAFAREVVTATGQRAQGSSA